MRLWLLGLLVIVGSGFAGSVTAEVKVETVVGGLTNPCGIAIQPGTGHIFVADSGGLRVVRIVDGKASDVITGFPRDVYGKGPMYDIGPLGLVFLDRDTLVVGGGGHKDGEELLRVYRVPAVGNSISAEEMQASYALPPEGDIQGEGNFYALAATDAGVYATANGDDTKGWVARLTRGAGGSFERFIATKEATEVDAPVGITISPRGEIVVGQMGEITVPEDSLLTFYNDQGGMLLNLETGLYDITALAYSPDGQLFATDFAWMATSEGGLYHLVATDDAGTQGVEAMKVKSLDKPTAMAFGADGALYVTVLGTAEEDGAAAGQLLRITGF